MFGFEALPLLLDAVRMGWQRINHGMSHNKGFQIIGDGAACAFRLDSLTVTVDKLVGDAAGELCLKVTSLGFQQNLADRLASPENSALPVMPVAEAACFEE